MGKETRLVIVKTDDTMRDIDRLAADLGYTLIYNRETKNEPLINGCWVSGNMIMVGDYDNEEYELISFFHEHGHKLVSQKFMSEWNNSTLMVEIEAWNKGINAARELNYIFSDDAIKWGYEQAMTYVGHDKREDSSWGTRVKPTLWINRN